MSKIKISKRRHLIKAISWSVIASVTTFFIGKAFGLDNDKAFMIVIFDRILKFILYYLHERTWFSSNLGILKRSDD